MAIKIIDGWGTGKEVRVGEDGRLYSKGVAETALAHASMQGDAYLLQTPKITLTSANASGILYIKNNNASRLLVLSELRTFLGKSNAPGNVELIAYSNPTTGTLISAGTTNTPHNRNFGQTIPAQVTALTGAEAKTITNGTEVIAAIVQDGTSAAAELDFALPNGSAIAVKVTPPAGNTSMDLRMRLSFYFVEQDD